MLKRLLAVTLIMAGATASAAAQGQNNWTNDRTVVNTFKLNPDNMNTIMVYDAEVKGNVRSFPGLGVPFSVEQKKRENWTKYAPGALWVEIWKDPSDAVVWKIDAPAADKYEVYAVVSGRESIIQASVGKSVGSPCKVDNMWDIMWDINHYPPKTKNAKWSKDIKAPDDYSKYTWAGWDRMSLGTVDVPAGVSEIEIRATTPGPDLAVGCIELVRPATHAQLREKAAKFKSSTQWLQDAKYGVFFHWTSSASKSDADGWKATWPRHGDRKVFPENVDAFDVDKFVEMVRQCGAGFVCLTATWSELAFPAPIKALEDMYPGHTSKRDLVMELADGLNKHGIKLILYYHGLGYPEWHTMVQKGTFVDAWCAIMEEAGNRYKDKLAGWWYDVGGVYWFNSMPFDRMGAAAKAGFPGRIIAYNNASFWPKTTDFQDYFTGEGPQFSVDESLLRYAPKGGNGIFSGGRHEGLQASYCFTMDNEWIHGVKEKAIPRPMYKKASLIEQVQESIERKMVPFIGFALYEDGTPNPKTLEVMQALKEAVRGK